MQKIPDLVPGISQVLGRNPLEMVVLSISAGSNGLKDKWCAMYSNLCDSVLFHYFE